MNIFVLGGYGSAGKLLCRTILKETRSHIVIAGRSHQKAKEYAEKLSREFTSDRISYCCVDAADRESLLNSLKGMNLIIVAAATTQYAGIIAETAIEAGVDYLDIYYKQSTYEILETLKQSIQQSGLCFITQAGFHPGLPSVFMRKGSAYFDTYDSAVIALAMNMHLKISDSVYELVDEISDYGPGVYKDGWRQTTSRDMLKIDFGPRIGIKSCVPMNMIEIRGIPEKYNLKEAGVYAAGFNWFVDYIIFPLIMISNKIHKGMLRDFWVKAFVWGLDNFSQNDEWVKFILNAKGIKDGKLRKVSICTEHNDIYEVTVIPVIALLKQYIEGTLRKPGLWMMGHIADPDRLFADMEKMGIRIQITIE